MKKQILTASAMIVACLTYGAGFQTLEQGASNLGTANAGATVNANADASAAFWNPSAGFNAGLKVGETKVDAAFSLVVSAFDFVQSGTGIQSGDAGCECVVPNFYVLHRLSEDFMLSLSVSPTYGLETDYEYGWVGSTHALNSEITTIDINPSVAYKVNDWLTISGGVSAQWMHGNLSQALTLGQLVPSVPPAYANMLGGESRVSGSAWGVGGNIGFTINYAEDGRIGFQWRSAVTQSLEGNLHVNSKVANPVELELTLPHTFTVGWYQRLRGDLKKFAVMADYSYTLWSSFDELDIKNGNTGQTQSYTHEAWRDVSRVAFGIHFFPFEHENTVLRLGSAWDQTPISNSGHRYARIPCTDRIWFSGGIGQKIGNVNIDFGYTFIYFYKDPKMQGEATHGGGALTGHFEGEAHVVSVQFGYKF